MSKDTRRFTWKETRALYEEGCPTPKFKMDMEWNDCPIDAILETEKLGIKYLEGLHELGVKAAEEHK